MKDRYIPDPYPTKDAVQRLLSLSFDSRRPLVGEGRGEAVGDEVKTKTFEVGDCTYHVQFNPARITSSAAKVDPQSLQERKCFLCPANLPPEQKGVPFKDSYAILVNPFPIFPRHLTIPDIRHTGQRILPRICDMLDLAEALDDFIIFYNGPKCGASAPDHAHFQAGNKGFLPIEKEWRCRKAGKIVAYGKAFLSFLDDAPRATLVIEAESKRDATTLFKAVYDSMELKPGEDEPMMNVLAWYEECKWIVCIFPRELHRPSCYRSEGDRNILISPASVDMGGVFITPLEKDFDKITAGDLSGILSEVCLSPERFHRLRQQIKEQLASAAAGCD
jgi:ATP adenylyltransferase/5',5'''-P-1,P-4-tetraphosphate phosphorylase II